MISLRAHASVNLVLNCAFAVCLVATLFQDFFAFLDYKVAPLTITHRLVFEDVTGEVYSTFAGFDSFACPFSRDPGIVTVCSNILNFQWAGYIFVALSLFLLISVTLCIINLVMIIFQQINPFTRFWYPHVVNAGVFVVAGGEYLLVSNVDGLEPPQKLKLAIVTEAGVVMLFVTATVAIITLFHYLFLKHFRNINSMEVISLSFVSKLLNSHQHESIAQPDAAAQAQNVELSQKLRSVQDEVAELRIERDALKRTVDEQTSTLKTSSKARQEAGASPEEIAVSGDILDAPDTSALQLELDEARVRIATLTGQLERSSGDKETAQKALETADKKLRDEKKAHGNAKKTVTELQTRVDQLLKEVANSQGVEQVKRLLEEEKQQELDRQKTLFTQQIRSRDEDIAELRAQLDVLKREGTRKEERAQEAEKKAVASEGRLKALEAELQAALAKLREAETAAQTLKNQKVELELRISTTQTELTAEREKYKHLDDTHKRSLVEMGQATSDQLDNLKKMYADSHQRELKTFQDSQTAREQKLQAELSKLRTDLSAAQEAANRLDTENKARTKAASEAEAEAKRLKTQVESLTSRLVHEEAQASKATETAAAEIRRARELADELASLQGKVKGQEDMHARMLSEQEMRHEGEKDRLKAFYEEMQGKELADVKLFYEQKVGKLTGDLVSERGQRAEAMDSAEKAIRDKEAAAAELARLNDTYLRLKVSLDTLQNSQNRDEDTLKTQLKEATTELETVKLACLQHSDYNELKKELEALKLRSNAQDREMKDLNSALDAVKSEEGLSPELDRLRGLLHSKDEDYQRQFEQLQAAQAETKRLTAEIDSLRAQIAVPSTKADTGPLQAKLDRKKEKLKAARAQLDALGQDKARQFSELTETYRLENDRMKDIYVQSFQSQTEDVKKMYESMLTALKAERDKLREENDAQAGKVSEAVGNWTRLKKELELMEAEKDSEVELRQKLYRQYQDLKTRFEERENELEDLNRLLDSLRKAGGNKEISLMYETQIKDLAAMKAQLAKELEDTRKERDDLRKELNLKDSELQSTQVEYMQAHKELFQAREQARPSTGWETHSQSSSHSVKETTVIEGLVVRTGQHPVLEKIAPLRREAPMTYSNVWKLFEGLMNEKVKLDRVEWTMGRQLRPMADFMLDFVYLHYGLKTLALKQLKALVLSLQELYENKHQYGILFARLLGIIHPRPLTAYLSAFLLVAQEEFAKIASRTLVKSESFSESYDILQYGGQVSLIDAMEIVIRLSRGNREPGERIISLMFPVTEENKMEITLVKVCGTLARMGKDSSYIFEMLDIDGLGTVDYHEFVDGLRLTLDIWVTQDEAEDLCGFVDDDGAGTVSKAEWLEKIDFQAYVAKATSRTCMVSKSAFLTALVEEFEHEVVQDYYRIRSLIKKPTVDNKAALELLRRLEPMIDERTAMQLFEEAKTVDPDARGGVSPEALCVVILRNRVGGLGIGLFGEIYTDLKALETPGRASEYPAEGRLSAYELEDARRSLPISRR